MGGHRVTASMPLRRPSAADGQAPNAPRNAHVAGHTRGVRVGQEATELPRQITHPASLGGTGIRGSPLLATHHNNHPRPCADPTTPLTSAWQTHSLPCACAACRTAASSLRDSDAAGASADAARDPAPRPVSIARPTTGSATTAGGSFTELTTQSATHIYTFHACPCAAHPSCARPRLRTADSC